MNVKSTVFLSQVRPVWPILLCQMASLTPAAFSVYLFLGMNSFSKLKSFMPLGPAICL